MDEKKFIDKSWDFKEDDTKISNHGFHTYPAMMIPQVARRLIETYGADAKVLCDPFMGTGTSILEAKLHSNFEIAYGIDINPLARLIAKVKVTPIDADKLVEIVSMVLENSATEIADYKISNKQIKSPDFKNIDYWFKPEVIRDLVIIKKNIESIWNEQDPISIDIRDFLLVSFSETVRLVSNTRNSEFKLYRMAESSLAKHNPDTFNTFKNKTLKNVERLTIFNKEAKNCKTVILNEDSRYRTSIPDDCVDLIVTSPPYGDSRTTVAYGQFSRLSLEWMEFDSKEVRSIDKVSLGGVPVTNLDNTLGSPSLNKSIRDIRNIDELRAKEVLSFYVDFYECVKEINRFMKRGGYLCFVVGNRTVKKQQIPTDDIIVELFQSVGPYNHEKTIIRNIPMKRMPKENSPTNVRGDKSSTMNHEYIIILNKK